MESSWVASPVERALRRGPALAARVLSLRVSLTVSFMVTPGVSLAAPGAGATPLAALSGSPLAADAPPPLAHACGPRHFEDLLLQQVNAFRAEARDCGARGRFDAASPLRWSAALAPQAFAHARDMAARSRLDHRDARGRGPAERAIEAGYGWSVFAENVAANQGDLAEVMAGWQASAGHCANLMNPSVTELGAACAPGVPGSAYKTYWAMELALPR